MPTTVPLPRLSTCQLPETVYKHLFQQPTRFGFVAKIGAAASVTAFPGLRGNLNVMRSGNSSGTSYHVVRSKNAGYLCDKPALLHSTVSHAYRHCYCTCCAKARVYHLPSTTGSACGKYVLDRFRRAECDLQVSVISTCNKPPCLAVRACHDT